MKCDATLGSVLRPKSYSHKSPQWCGRFPCLIIGATNIGDGYLYLAAPCAANTLPHCNDCSTAPGAIGRQRESRDTMMPQAFAGR